MENGKVWVRERGVNAEMEAGPGCESEKGEGIENDMLMKLCGNVHRYIV